MIMPMTLYWTQMTIFISPVEAMPTWQGDDATDPLHAFSGYRDISIMKLSSDGAYQWHTFYGSDSGDDRGQDINLDTTSLYVAGRCSASWTGDTPSDEPLHSFSGGPGDAFVIKFNVPAIAPPVTSVPTFSEWGMIIMASADALGYRSGDSTKAETSCVVLGC